MGTVWDTPSPESITVPVTHPEAYRDSTAWLVIYIAGMLKVSNNVWVIFSLLALRSKWASIIRSGCASGDTCNSLWKVWCQIWTRGVYKEWGHDHECKPCLVQMCILGCCTCSLPGAASKNCHLTGLLTFSMSSQLVTMPCSMGYLRVRIPLLLLASSPTYWKTIPWWCNLENI